MVVSQCRQWMFSLLMPVSFAIIAISASAQAPDATDMSAEEAAMMAAFQASLTPGEPHERLASLTGEYTGTVKSYESPDLPPEVSESAVSRTMELDGRVMREEWTGSVMGMPFHGIGRTGYDNVTQRYWTTWTDNLSTGLFVGYGSWDAERDALVIEGEMPDPVSGEMIATRSEATYGEGGAEQMRMYRVVDGEPVLMMEFDLARR